MRKMFVGLVIVVVGITCGCTASRATSGGVLPDAREILPGSKVLILPVEDGVEAKDGPAEGSGRAMTTALKDTLIAHGFPPLVAEVQDLPSAFHEAEELGYAYVLRGQITTWEDNATEWSGRPDLAELSVELFSLETRSMIASVTHSVEGGDSGKQPHRFIPELADHTLGRIFGWSATVVTKY